MSILSRPELIVNPEVPPEPSPRERLLLAEGYRHQAVALVADINTIAESWCLECGCPSLVILPFWKLSSCVLLVRCASCGSEEER